MRKIVNDRGVSILIALVVFLLAALTGTAVLTMATSNAGRFTHAREDQQRYLSVASAVQLIREELTGHTVTVTVDPAAGAHAFGVNADSDGVEVKHEGSSLFAKMNALTAKCRSKVMSDYYGASAFAAAEEPQVKIEFTLNVRPAAGGGASLKKSGL